MNYNGTMTGQYDFINALTLLGFLFIYSTN